MKTFKSERIDTLFCLVWLKTRKFKVEITQKKNYLQLENEELALRISLKSKKKKPKFNDVKDDKIRILCFFIEW